MSRRAAALAVLFGATALLLWWLGEIVSTRVAGEGAAAPAVARSPGAPSFRVDAAEEAAQPLRPHGAPADEEPAPRAASLLAEPAGLLLELEIVWPDGSPARAAPVALAVGGAGHGAVVEEVRVLGRGVTGSDGRTFFHAPAGPASLYVGGIGGGIHVEALPGGGGRRRVVLPEGATISGVVTVNGEPPGERVIALSLRRGGADRDAALPAPVRDALRGAVGAWGEVHDPDAQRVTGDGSFLFGGLAAGEEHEFVRPWRRYALDEGAVVSAMAPTEGLVVALVARPLVRGRVVWKESRLPVPGCRVAYELELGPVEFRGLGAGSESSGLAADEQGRFAIPLHAQERPVSALRIELSDPGRHGQAEHGFGPIPYGVDTDLGDLLLEPARAIVLRVVDESGLPVGGALAVLQGGRNRQSPPTDEQGRTELRGAPVGETELVVWAHGFEAERVTARGNGDERLDVRLKRCASLSIRVAVGDGEAPDDLVVRLAASEPPFSDGESYGQPDARTSLGGSVSSRSSTWIDDAVFPPRASGEIDYPVPPDGVVTLTCLRPFVPLRLSVVHDFSRRLWGEEPIVLSPGEGRSVDVWIPAPEAR